MAKNDNLKDFLTDVADAIRAKKGTTDLINPQDFSAEIASIETGGGGESGGGGASAGAVNFRDYDGTILHSFSKDEFLALEALPELPTQPGLICQEWNWDLEEAQDYVQKYGILEIGATYITDDGKTRLYIRIAEKGKLTLPLYFTQTTANGVTIDWGDDSPLQTLDGKGSVNTTHTYADAGEYVISLEVKEGCQLTLSANSTSACVLGSTGNANKVYCNMLQKLEVGNNVKEIGAYALSYCTSLSRITIPKGVVSISNYMCARCYSLSSVVIPNGVKNFSSNGFLDCYSLSSVVLPNSVTSIGTYNFKSCYSLSSVVIPNGVKTIGSDTFYYCYTLASVVIPDNVTSIETYAFSNCYTLSSVVIPNGVTTLPNYIFNYCYTLASVVIPDSVTSIGTYAFSNCYSLSSVVMPASLKTIYTSAFQQCYGLALMDCRKVTSIPTLSATAALQNTAAELKIIVPDELYDAWIAASNWSSYASKIVKASEYTD